MRDDMTDRRTGHGGGARGAAGLTLIEVLLSVAILVVGFSVLLTAASRCLAVMKSAKNYQAAHAVLDRGDLEHPLFLTNRVEDLAVNAKEYDGLTYSRVVEDDEDKDELYLVRTRVSWGDGGQYEEVLSYVYFPDKEKK